MPSGTKLWTNSRLHPVQPWCSTASRAVHPSSAGDDRPLTEAIAAGLAAVATPWEFTDTATERQYELLLETEHYDAWLIHWPAGTGLDAHDHGGSAGAFAIVSGVLDEDVVESGTVWTRRFTQGRSVAFDDHHVHAVVNRSDEPATSVHVYWPPLRSMRFQRADLGGRSDADRVEAADVS